MAVQVGQTLDKYELLERVGQGGMAIVYRGRDNSLRREVAVKVLHQHLAEHREARERFEREAHAVAKLRHENILEIYDFSGTESAESYIVTEFIDGQSLKEFITDHSIRYPEIGAMIALQVCKALQHAHSQGILHRDVKPENVMIRSDGVVKLTDFGIAQMIDLQRLTVTGQLLGSPAYMSPEHVNGGQLDFRTDVFAIGIVLYQLITGELPFKGKNPHEILKRIAEGEYLDPRIVNPHVGKELGRIISTSMKRDKEDRYADVSMMLAALEKFLDGSGLTTPREELSRFFNSPVSYEMALKARLVDHLVRIGREQLADQQPVALESLNRVLTMEPDNADVLGLLDHLGARRRRLRIAAIAGGVLLTAGLLWGTKSMLARTSSQDSSITSANVADVADTTAVADASSNEVSPDASPFDAGGGLASSNDATTTDAAKPPPTRIDAGNQATTRIDPDLSRRDAGNDETLDAAPALDTARNVVVSVFPPEGAEFRVNDGVWTSLGGPRRTITIPKGKVRIEGRNLDCCKASSVVVDETATSGRTFNLKLPFNDGTLVPRCGIAGVKVQIADKIVGLGKPTSIKIPKDRIAAYKVKVFFYNSSSYARDLFVALQPGKSKEVMCPPEI